MMNKILKLGILFCILGVWGCKQKIATDKKVDKSAVKDVIRDSINHKGQLVDEANNDVFIPEHDYQLDQKIKKAVAHLIDTTKIYQIYQYQTHHVVHILDTKDRSKTGIIYVSKDLKEKNFIRTLDRNPYRCDFPTNTTYLALPVYDVSGISRKEIESKIPNVVWDNQGEPGHIYTRSVSSNFAATNRARGYNFSIIGTEGPMAVQSKLYIEDNRGKYIDSIEYIGSEIWHPAITDDGRFVAYLYGRAFPKEGGGKVIQHLTIYDIKTKEFIFEVKNFKQEGSRIGFGFNFFYFSDFSDRPEYKIRYILDPHNKKIYKIETKGATGWGAFKHDGVYAHPHDPPSLRLLSWKKDFEVIEFKNYKQ